MSGIVGVEYGCPFSLAGPIGVIASFNEEGPSEYVGVLDPSECSGLDSPEVREDTQPRVEDDGSVQGNNFYGPRPIVLAGIIRANSLEQRNERVTRLMAASNAMRANAELLWTPHGGQSMRVLVRRQQPLRVTGGFIKKFQIPLVASDPRLYSATQHTKESAINVAQEPENLGNFTSPAIFELVGPQTNPVIKNETTGKEIKFTYALASGHTLIIDTLNHTVYDGATNAYAGFNFTASTWFGLNAAGKTKFKCTTGTMKTIWRDAWM